MPSTVGSRESSSQVARKAAEKAPALAGRLWQAKPVVEPIVLAALTAAHPAGASGGGCALVELLVELFHFDCQQQRAPKDQTVDFSVSNSRRVRFQ